MRFASVAAALAAVLVAHAAPARADDPAEALLLEGVVLFPLGTDGRVGPSSGLGIGIDIMPEHDEGLVLAGAAFGAFSPESGGDYAERRDVYDLSFHVGVRMPFLKVFMPYLAAGVDLIATTSRQGDDVARGTTLGGDVEAGFAMWVGQHLMLRLSAGYLAGIVPGTGDALQSLALKVALGGGRAGPAPYEPPPEPPVPTPPTEPVPPPRIPLGPVQTTVNGLPPEVANPAITALSCEAQNLALESVSDERIGQEGMLLYRKYVVVGCGRRTELRCYDAGEGAPMSCVAAPGAGN